jgi:hypothetical protein
VQVLTSLKVCAIAPSVPQLKVVGVHDWLLAGFVPKLAQLTSLTVVPSERKQETVCASAPEFAFTTQEPVRVCGRFVPQPVLGVQEE